MDHQQHGQNAGQTALTFAEWCVLLGGNHFLDGLEEGVAREKVKIVQEGPSSRTAADTGGRLVWLNHCTPRCLCHEDCDQGKGPLPWGGCRRKLRLCCIYDVCVRDGVGRGCHT